MIYILAHRHNEGMYWVNHWKLKEGEYKVITRYEQILGHIFSNNDDIRRIHTWWKNKSFEEVEQYISTHYQLPE